MNSHQIDFGLFAKQNIAKIIKMIFESHKLFTRLREFETQRSRDYGANWVESSTQADTWRASGCLKKAGCSVYRLSILKFSLRPFVGGERHVAKNEAILDFRRRFSQFL